MKSFSIGALIAAAAALGLSIFCTFTLDNALSWTDRVNLIFDPASAESFDAYYFAFGTLPRFAAAAIGGALLGLVGSLLQQLTQNPMTSPLTLGTSSGGWLAVVLISAFFPAAAGAWLSLGAFAGALAAFGLILLIAGPRGMTGVALIIAGMVVNLLFGAIATAVVLLRAQFVENVFLWGAGDLAQNGWGGITALLPQTVPVVILLLIFAPRALALISLGDEGARARGLPIVPVFGVLAALGIWLSSAFIAAAGVINFTGLIAPNIARRVGFVNPRTQLCASMLIGAALLCATDAAAQGLTSLTGNIVPTGAAFAMVVSALYFGGAVGSLGSLTAAGGSFVVLLVLLGLSKSSRFSPDVVVLMGIAISAFLDSAVTLALSRGTMENYFILQWLSGSTYRTTPLAAAMLLGAVLVLISIAFAASRSMTLLSISRDFAQSRGLSLTRSALGLLTLCALLCASATAAMGPVAFVGLVAPHMAVMIGARTVKTELCTAALLGAALVSWADWLGQVLIAPAQIPAGTLASIIGAGYFLILLVVSRR